MTMLDSDRLASRFPAFDDVISQTHVERKNEITSLYRDFAHFLDGKIKDGRLKALVMTNLETSCMYATKAIDDELIAKENL